MKIRNGFVSNSSSSSFIVFGNKIRFTDITDELLENKKIYASSWDYCCDGADFFRINKEMFDLFFQHGGGDIDFYNVQTYLSEGGVIDKDLIDGDKIEVFVVERDYHSVQDDDISEFVNRYVDLPEIKSSEEIKELTEKMENLRIQLEDAGLEAYQDKNGKTKLRKKT